MAKHTPPAEAVLIAVLLCALVAPGCSGKKAAPLEIGGERLTWADMNLDQRKTVMRERVLPVAAEVFGNWRPDRYSGVDCTLCHGRRAGTGDFSMPTDHLPRLSGKLFLGPEFDRYPETTDLKLKELVPRVAGALGKKSFSVITRKGFGCYSCHLGPDGPMFGN